MDENEVLGVDPEPETGTGDMEAVGVSEQIVIDTSEFATEIAVLEEKFDILTGQVTMAADKITGCYCMLLILAVLGLRNVLRSIIRKIRGGMEDV